MATYEIYVGGPASQNFSRSMLPAAPFVPAAAAFQAVKPAAHKGPTGYGLTRVIDVTQHAMAEFLREQPLAQGDVLGSVLIPKNVVFKGVYFEVQSAQGTATTTLTPSLRGVTGGTLPAIAANTVANGYAKIGATAWTTTSAAIEGTDKGFDFFIDQPTMLDLTLTVLPASGLGKLRIMITPMVENLDHGQY